MSLAAAAAGADGIIVEVHNEPDEAICDGPQAIATERFADYAEQVQRVAELAGKEARAGLDGLAAAEQREGRRSRRRPDRRLDRPGGEAAPRSRGRGLRSRASILDARASSSGRSTAPRGSVAEAVEGAEIVFCAAPVGALPDARRGGGRGGRPTTRWSPTSARPSASCRRAARAPRASASSAATRSPAPRPPGSRTRAPTSSRARAGT